MFALVGVYLILTKTFVARAIVMGQLASATGAEASCTSASLSLTGEAEIRGLVLRAPGVPGPAGEFLTIDRVHASADPWSLLTGTPRILSVDLEHPHVRISQSLKDGGVNVASLRSTARASGGTSRGPSSPSSLPRIALTDGVIELGEHDVTDAPDGYRGLKELAVAGLVEERAGATGESVISFREVDASGNATGLLDIQGTVSSKAIALTVGDLDLSKVAPASLPTPFREGVSRLSMIGKVTGTEFRYGFDGVFSAGANLVDIGLTLPVDAQPAEDEDGNHRPMEPDFENRRLRVQGVSGRVTLDRGIWSGTLAGKAEEMPCDLAFEWKGAGADSPFGITLKIKPFELEKKPALIKFAPPVAQLRFSQFGDPTGLISGEIRITRDAPGPNGPSEVHTAGEIDITGGSAAFHKFPYRFNELRGRVTFDAKGITIVGLDGKAPSGAVIHAEGTLVPPNNPVANILVRVKGLPTDETLSAAMRTRGRILDELFSKENHQRLLAAGLIREPGSPGSAPEFALGGTASVDVEVTRFPLADGEGDWHDTVTVHFPRVGILPDDFPFPLIGTDITLVKKDYDAVISGGQYTGLQGGTAEITAQADLLRVDDPAAEFIPEVSVQTTALPLDELLVQALPPGREALGDGRTIPGIVRSLGLRGKLTGSVKVGMSPQGETLYDVRLAMRGIEAAPKFDGPEGAMLGDVTGTLAVTERHLETKFRADVLKTHASDSTFPITPAGSMELETRFDFTRPDTPSKLKVVFSGTRLDLSAPLEGIVRRVSEEGATAIAEGRADHSPAGVSDLRVELAREGGGPISMTASATAATADFQLLGTRVGVTESIGRAMLVREGDAPTRYEFDGFDAAIFTVSANERTSVGRWRLEGPIIPDAKADRPLEIHAIGARFESPLLLAVCDKASPRSAALLREFQAAGSFDIDLVSAPDGPSGVLRPTSAAVTVSGGRANFTSATGSVEFAGDAAELKDLRLNADGWSVGLRGRVVSNPDGSTLRDIRLDLDADSLRPELRGCLPQGLRESLTDLKAEVKGAISIKDAPLEWSTSAQGLDTITTTNSIRIAGAEADVGAEVKEFAGTIGVNFNRVGEAPPRYDLTINAETAHVSGLRVTEGLATIRTSDAPDAPNGVTLAEFGGRSHGGRVSGNATLGAKDQAQRRRFEANLQLADLRFASVLTDFRELSGEQPPKDEDPTAARGMLDANVTLSGYSGDISTRRGRGTVTIGGGPVLKMPLVVALVRVSNLQLPIGESVNYGAVEFFLEGQTVNVEQFALESPSVGLYGFGTATWPDMALDMRFRSRSRARVPIISDAIEALRGAIVQGVITGTAAKPEVSVSTFAGTTKFIGRLLGRDPTEQERRLEQIEKTRNDARLRERDRDAQIESR